MPVIVREALQPQFILTLCSPELQLAFISTYFPLQASQNPTKSDCSISTTGLHGVWTCCCYQIQQMHLGTCCFVGNNTSAYSVFASRHSVQIYAARMLMQMFSCCTELNVFHSGTTHLCFFLLLFFELFPLSAAVQQFSQVPEKNDALLLVSSL